MKLVLSIFLFVLTACSDKPDLYQVRLSKYYKLVEYKGEYYDFFPTLNGAFREPTEQELGMESGFFLLPLDEEWIMYSIFEFEGRHFRLYLARKGHDTKLEEMK